MECRDDYVEDIYKNCNIIVNSLYLMEEDYLKIRKVNIGFYANINIDKLHYVTYERYTCYSCFNCETTYLHSLRSILRNVELTTCIPRG